MAADAIVVGTIAHDARPKVFAGQGFVEIEDRQRRVLAHVDMVAYEPTGDRNPGIQDAFGTEPAHSLRPRC